MITYTKYSALVVALIGLVTLAQPVSASEVTGTFGTGGVSTGIEGTVVSAPSASPSAGTYTSSKSVTLSVSGASSIRWTDDGSTPTCTSTLYTGSISVTSTKTIKAIACYPNNESSSVATFLYTIKIPQASSSGGGGGSRSNTSTDTTTATPTSATTTAITTTSISQEEQLKNQLAALMAQLAQLQNVQGSGANASAGVSSMVFTRDLDVGSTGTDVRELQIFLNSKSFLVATVGAGSPGNETNSFGAATRAALAKYQTARGISPATGYFGPVTRAQVNAELGTQNTTTTASQPTQSPSVSTNQGVVRDLEVGSEGSDVRALQQILIAQGYTIAAGITGYFGEQTRVALVQYQTAQGISPATGYFGAVTRTQMKAAGLSGVWW